VKYDITCSKKILHLIQKKSDIETFGGGIIAAFISFLSLLGKRERFQRMIT